MSGTSVRAISKVNIEDYIKGLDEMIKEPHQGAQAMADMVRDGEETSHRNTMAWTDEVNALLVTPRKLKPRHRIHPVHPINLTRIAVAVRKAIRSYR